MKTFAKRTTLLVVLVVFAVGWVFLMSLDLSKQGSSIGDDGSQATMTYLDKSEFPRVTTYLLVEDGSGQPIINLQQDAFALTEDKIAVDVEGFIGAGQQPVVAMLIIDYSGSMDDYGKMEGAKEAAHIFLDQLQPGRDRVGLIAFEDSPRTLHSLTLVSETDLQTFKSSISRLAPTGGTAYYDAVYSAILALQSQSGRKVVIALTDGDDNQSRYSLNSTTQLAQENDVPIYTIGLGSDVKASILERMARETGGQYYFSPEASQLAALYQDLAQALQNEYSLTYTSPTSDRDGTQRDVAVAVTHPGAVLSAIGAYNPGGILKASLNLPLFIGLAVLLVGLLFVPQVIKAAKRQQKQPEGTVPNSQERYPQPQADYRPPPTYPPPSHQPSPPPSHQPSPPPSYSPPAYPQQPPPAYTPPPTQPTPGQTAATCTHCGASLRPQARFCGSCGRPREIQ